MEGRMGGVMVPAPEYTATPPTRRVQFCLMTRGLRRAGCGQRPVLRTSNVPCLFFISKGSRWFYELDVLLPGQGGSGRSVTRTALPTESHTAEAWSPATPSPSVAVPTPSPHWILARSGLQGSAPLGLSFSGHSSWTVTTRQRTGALGKVSP